MDRVVEPPVLTGMTVASSNAIDGRVYSTRSRVGGESPTEVMSSGSRAGAVRTGSASSVAEAAPARAGAKVAEVGMTLGTAAGMPAEASSLFQMPVWPADEPIGTATGALPPRTLASAAAAAATAAPPLHRSRPLRRVRRVRAGPTPRRCCPPR